MIGGAWPFLVGGVNCLLNCDNERDRPLMLRGFGWGVGVTWSSANPELVPSKTTGENPGEAGGDNRSVMPLDVRNMCFIWT